VLRVRGKDARQARLMRARTPAARRSAAFIPTPRLSLHSDDFLIFALPLIILDIFITPCHERAVRKNTQRGAEDANAPYRVYTRAVRA
jgi:hypothetical protein